MQPDHAKAVTFAGRVVYVTILYGRGLAIVDTARQEGISSSQVRTWVAHKNSEMVLYLRYLSPDPPVSFKQVGLAIRGYAAFLDPRLERPTELDSVPHDYVYPPDEPSSFLDDDDSDYNEHSYTWQNWVRDNQRPNLYDDHAGDMDPGRPKFPTRNYTKPRDSDEP